MENNIGEAIFVDEFKLEMGQAAYEEAEREARENPCPDFENEDDYFSYMWSYWGF